MYQRNNFAKDLSTLSNARNNLRTSSVTELDRKKIEESRRLESLIMQTLQEDTEIHGQVESIKSTGISLADITGVDNLDFDTSEVFTIPGMKQKVFKLRKRIYDQEKRKKFIKRKISDLTGENPISNRGDFDETIKRVNEDEKGLDMIVMSGHYDPENMIKAEVRKKENLKNLKKSKLFDNDVKDKQKDAIGQIKKHEDEMAKAFLNMYPYMEKGEAGGDMMHKVRKAKADQAGLVHKANKVVIKSLEERLENKEQYFNEMMQKIKGDDFYKAREKHFRFNKDQLELRKDRQKLNIKRETDLIGKLDKDSIDNLEGELYDLLRNMNTASQQEVEFHTKNNLFDLEMGGKMQELEFSANVEEIKMSGLARKAERMLNLKRMALNNQYKGELIEQMMLDRREDREMKKKLVEKNLQLIDAEIQGKLVSKEIVEYSDDGDKYTSNDDREDSKRLFSPEKEERLKKQFLSEKFSMGSDNNDNDIKLNHPELFFPNNFQKPKMKRPKKKLMKCIIYIKGIYNLPDFTSVTKLFINVEDFHQGERIIYKEECFPIFESNVLNPQFEHYFELDKEKLPFSVFITLKIVTFDRKEKKMTNIGHCFFPIFRDENTGYFTNLETKSFELNEGSFDIPIYIENIKNEMKNKNFFFENL